MSMPWALFTVAVVLILFNDDAYEKGVHQGWASTLVIVVCLILAAYTWLWEPYGGGDDDDDDDPEVPSHVPPEWSGAGAPLPPSPPRKQP